MECVDREIEELMNLYGNDILRISYMYLKDKSMAEDAFQEVFVKVYKNFHKISDVENIKSWLISIAINTCRDMLRTSWFKRIICFGEKEEYYNSIESEDNVEKLVMSKIENKEIFNKVINLPNKYKEPILLYYYEELSTVEIASVLKVPEGTVRSRLHRGRKLLKDIIDRKIEYGG